MYRNVSSTYCNGSEGCEIPVNSQINEGQLEASAGDTGIANPPYNWGYLHLPGPNGENTENEASYLQVQPATNSGIYQEIFNSPKVEETYETINDDLLYRKTESDKDGYYQLGPRIPGDNYRGNNRYPGTKVSGEPLPPPARPAAFELALPPGRNGPTRCPCCPQGSLRTLGVGVLAVFGVLLATGIIVWKVTRQPGRMPDYQPSEIFAAKLNAGKMEIGKFDSAHYYTANLYVVGVKVWRVYYNWGISHGTFIVGGLQVFYSDGQSPIYGDTTSNDSGEFHLNSGDRVAEISVWYGDNNNLNDGLIDRLSFTGQARRVLLEFGGNGGYMKVVVPPRANSYLAGINGREVKVSGVTAIDALCFIWATPK